ncbi:MAG: InlB B-repeat-containing protein [Paludibacteraceae bacterium]|nr:InlB B-repeat-containing protein [Paludibacteraceae bacterium]
MKKINLFSRGSSALGLKGAKTLLLALTLLCGVSNAWADHDKHYGRIIVSSSGNGTVYIKDANNNDLDNPYDWDCGQDKNKDDISVKIGATANTGYSFTQWNDGKTENPYTVTQTATSKDANNRTTSSYTATFSPIAYNITYTNVEGATHSNQATYTIENAITFTAASKDGYTFDKWTPASIAKGTTGNQTVTASWTANTYTVTLNNQGATTAGTTSVSATFDAAMPGITAPTKTGYTFNGYFDAETGGTKYYNADGTSARTWNKASNTTLYAQWTGKTYSVTLNPNGGTPGAVKPVTFGQAMPETSKPSRDGFIFMGYFDTDGKQYYADDMTSANNWDKDGNATLYAKWHAYQINYNLNYGDAKTNLFAGWSSPITLNGATLTYNPATGYITVNGSCTGSTSVIIQDLTDFLNTGEVFSFAYTDYNAGASGSAGYPWFETCNFRGVNPKDATQSHLARQGVYLSGTYPTKENMTAYEDYRYMGVWLQNANAYDGFQFKLRFEKSASLATVASPSGKYIQTGDAYGTLADAPTREGYQFEGWYTEPTCQPANKVTATTIFNGTSNQVLYAHWITHFPFEMSCDISKDLTVGDVKANAFTFTHADNPTVSIVENSISPINDGSGKVITYADNKITAVNAGSATITFTQAPTDKVEEGTFAVTFNVTKVNNTLAVAANSHTMYVDDEWTSIVSNKNSDATITTTSTDATIAYYDVTSNKVVAPNSEAKSFTSTNITLHILQAETYKYAGVDKTITVTVNKYDNTLAWNQSSVSMNYNQEASVAVTNKNSDGEITYSVSPTGAGRYDATTGKFYSYNQNVDATLQATQAETYKYKGKTINIPVYIRPAADGCNVVNVSAQKSLNDTYDSPYELSGPGKNISFNFWKLTDITLASSPHIDGYDISTGQWVKISDMTVSTTHSKKEFTLTNRNIRKIRMYSGSENNTKYVDQVIVTRDVYLEPTETEFSMTKIRDKGAITHTLNVNYSTCNAGQKITVMSNNPNITVSPASVIMNSEGTAQFTITYVDLDHPSDDEATLTVFNSTYTSTVKVHGKTTGVIDPTVTNTLPSTRMVDDAAIDLNSYWTTNSDAPMQFSFEFTPNGSTDGSKDVTLTGSILTFGQAGSLKVKMHTDATNFYNEYNGEKTITINRYANAIETVTIDGVQTLEKYIGLDGSYAISASTTANKRTAVNITKTSDPNNAITLAGGANTGTMTTALNEGDVTFSIAQAQDYKYEAASTTATVHVGKGNVCTVADDAEEKTVNSYSYSFSATEGHVWTFAAKKGTVSSVTAQEYYNNGWHDLATLNLNDSYQYYTFVLNSNATQVQINGISPRFPLTDHDIVIKQAKITKYTTITANDLSMSKIKGEADLDSIITITHNTCGTIKMLNSNPDWFTVAQTASTANSVTYKVTYKKCDDVATHSATLTFYDQNTVTTMTVNGETTEMQYPKFTNSMKSEYVVEEETLNLATLWTSNNKYTAPTYTATFVPDGENHDGGTTPTLAADNTIALTDAGTLTITMSQDGNQFYYAKSETIQVVIKRRVNTMTINLDGSTDAPHTLHMYLGEGKLTNVITDNTQDTLYTEQVDGFKVATYYRSYAWTNASATTGEMHVEAWQEQNYKYEAVTGGFTVIVEEMPMSACSAIEDFSSDLVLQADKTEQVYNVSGEYSNTLTYTVEVSQLNTTSGSESQYMGEYSVDGTNWEIFQDWQRPTAGNKSYTIPTTVTKIRFTAQNMTASFIRTPQITISSLYIPRTTYVKVGTDEASVVENDIYLPAQTLRVGEAMPQQQFVIAYSTCDQTADDHIRIQCNKGAAIFSQDNINTETSPSGTATITVNYTPTQWGEDQAIIAVYNRSVRRCVYIPLNVLPYQLNGGDWSNAANWEGNIKPNDNNADVYVAGDATIKADAEVHSLLIAEGKTLTVGHGATLTVENTANPLKPVENYGSMCIQANARVDIKEGVLNLNELALEGGLYEQDGTQFGVPQLDLNGKASVALTNNDVYYYYNINYNNYYPLALPFESKLEDLRYAHKPTASTSKVIGEGKNIRICTYDGEQRALTNKSTQTNSSYWRDLAATDILKPNVGYIITAKTVGGLANMRFTMHIDNAWLTNGEQMQVGEVIRNQTSVGAWNGNDGKDENGKDVHWNNKGWNLVASPYMCTPSLSDVYAQDWLYIQDSVGEWGDYEPNVEQIHYVTVPTYMMNDYDQYALDAVSEKLMPYWCYYIQAAKDGYLTFKPFGTDAGQAPARLAARSGADYNEQKAYIRLSGNDMTDMLGMLVDERYSGEYEINADLVKMLGDANSLRAYMRYNTMNLAYLALDEASAKDMIPMTVRIPAAGSYTWSIANSSVTDQLDGLYLTDFETGTVTNLLQGDYTFTASAGTLSDRFALNAVVRGQEHTPTAWERVSKQDGAQKLIYKEHLYILRKGVVYDGQGKRVGLLNK